MNQITLNGIINNIQPSHTLNGTPYMKANAIVKNSNGKESVINISYKGNSSRNIANGDSINILGNVRSRSTTGDNQKQKTQIFVYTYLDSPETVDITNSVEIDGTVVKLRELRTFDDGNTNIQFTLHNQLTSGSKTTNSFIPCICWNELAKAVSKLSDGTKIKIFGELRSREYKKYTDEENFDVLVAHEVFVTRFEVLDNEEDI